jgi:hypothetical protein
MTMTKTHRSALVLGLVALAAAGAAGAATIRSPYASSATPAVAARLAADGQEGLDLDSAAAAALMERTDQILEIEAFPIAPGTTKTLRLHRFEVAAPGARVTIRGAGGETSVPMPSVSHFAGIVEGEPDSSVYVGATGDRVVAYVHSSLGHSYVGPDETERGFVVRMAESPMNAAAASVSWRCRTEELPAALTAMAQPRSAAPALPDAVGYKQASVMVETDNQLYTRFAGDVGKLSTYVLTLFGATNVIYERDLAMHLTVTNIHTWSFADPYTGGDTLTQLYQFGTWWHANKPVASNPRTLVHYLSGHPVAGGIAWLGVLCGGDFQADGNMPPDWGGAYSLTQIFATYPLQLWDQDSSAHEMGHNVGSPHTHCMGPGAPYNYPTWTDECYNGESGCYSGTEQNPGIGGGTIMSYCHLLGWQYMSLVFHPRCINDIMLPAIADASCLGSPATFVDVPTTDPFFHYVETVYQTGVASGCNTSPLMYCPANAVTRQQMAVFLLKAVHGPAYAPPSCSGSFADVPCPSQYANWIEELAAEGVTSGCGSGNYCPADPVTRQQMAVFLLKSEHGSSYTPPSCSSAPFPDVPCPSQYANWIKELVTEGITGGCAGGDYCPTSSVTRAQMAVFLTKTFALSW